MMVISLVFILLATPLFAASDFNLQIHAMYESMPRDKFVEYFNNLGLSFNITDQEVTPFESGVKFDPESYNNLSVIKHEKADDLPDNFDPRQQWPQCPTIQEIYNQGACGSCWTFGTATSISDRYCIQKNVTVRLSEQDFGCMSQRVCKGGNPDKAFQFWIDQGLVTQECKPYDISALQQGKCEKQCKNGQDYQADKHKGSSQSSVSADEDTIMTELFKNGPIQAVFNVYEDFKRYTGGIYTHTFGPLAGLHSVRVIGYGVENGVKYWLAANSWGTGWGEGGYFRIKRFSDASFEEWMIAGFP